MKSYYRFGVYRRFVEVRGNVKVLALLVFSRGYCGLEVVAVYGFVSCVNTTDV